MSEPTELRDKLNEIVEEKKMKVLPENIREGVTIYGVKGIYKGTDTTDADATEDDIIENKVAYVQGQRIVGNIKKYTSTTKLPLKSPVETNTSLELLTTQTGHVTKDNTVLTIDKALVASIIGLTSDKIVEGNTILGVDGFAKLDGDLQINYTTLNPSIRATLAEEVIGDYKYFKNFKATLNGKVVSFIFASTTVNADLKNYLKGNVLAYAIGYEVVTNRRMTYFVLDTNEFVACEINIITGAIGKVFTQKIYNGEEEFTGTIRSAAIAPSLYSGDFVYEYDYGTDTNGYVIRNYMALDGDVFTNLQISIEEYVLEEGSVKVPCDMYEVWFCNDEFCIVDKSILIVHQGEFLDKIASTNVPLPNGMTQGTVYYLGVNSISNKIAIALYGENKNIWMYDLAITEDKKVVFSSPVVIENTKDIAGVLVSAFYNFGNDMLLIANTGASKLINTTTSVVSMSATLSVTSPVSNAQSSDYTYFVQNSERTYLYALSLDGKQVISGITLDDEYYYSTDELELTTTDKVLEGEKIINNSGVVEGTMPNNGKLNYEMKESVQTIPAGYTSGGTIAAVDFTKSISYNNCLRLTQDILGDI